MEFRRSLARTNPDRVRPESLSLRILHLERISDPAPRPSSSLCLNFPPHLAKVFPHAVKPAPFPTFHVHEGAMSQEALRAAFLLEALPYIREFYGQTIVI
ncbi:MAG: hypothetical protein EOM37_19575, partial [Proteobacteria bacterium]|nr:hypothetical protein [Pseudomonadota bacterium]